MIIHYSHHHHGHHKHHHHHRHLAERILALEQEKEDEESWSLPLQLPENVCDGRVGYAYDYKDFDGDYKHDQRHHHDYHDPHLRQRLKRYS